MQKTISIIRGVKKDHYEAFHGKVKKIIDAIVTTGPDKLHYTVTVERPPALSVIPYRREKIAVVSVTSTSDEFIAMIEAAEGYAGTFKVDEALPVAYQKAWSDGEPSPGACLLTLFRQKRKIEYETFIDRWYNGHTPLTLKIHPVYHYSRNRVTGVIGVPPVLFDGIVEEHTRTKRELLHPYKFFTKSGFAIPNMIKTYYDVNGFIDYRSIETFLVQEFHVIS